eukprot:Mycagemm_TRINITY_DN11193_c0_g1::TRINITY_DN11193_c0_g1_i1::g.4534::m.4534 type:complete len:199 gc:universal TRINITY_DN11193_c0_g1_i1:52-648(+)
MAAFTGRTKIKKDGNTKPDATEELVAQALYDLELTGNSDLKADLRDLHIAGAKEIDVSGGTKAIVISVPFPLLKRFKSVQTRLVRELEKKFSGKHVLFVGARRILPKEKKNNRVNRQQRPRSRTLTKVHEAVLDDLVFPTEIVAKRTRIRLDGSRIIKVYLDRRDQKDVEHKLNTYSTVYKKLTGKDVSFQFPTQQTE